MTASRGPAEPGVRRFEATVRRADGPAVVLDGTHFYPEAGGQPADRGWIDGVRVTDVRERDGEVVHELAEPAVGAGEAVTCRIDDAFRTYCTRAHTASHVLFGAGRRLFDDLGYGGFDIGTETVRVDLAADAPVGDEALIALERLSNRAVWESRPVSWAEVPVEAARGRDEVAFNAKTEEGVMAGAETVRIVTVGAAPNGEGEACGIDAEADPESGAGPGDEDGAGDGDGTGGEADDPWDVAACGGTHVRNTGEIGPIEVIERSNPGEGLTRVEFAVGPAAVDRRAAVHGAALDAARAAGVAIEDLPDAVARLEDERGELGSRVAELEREVLAGRLGDLDRVRLDGAAVAVGRIDGFGPNDVREPLTDLVGGDGPDAAAVVGTDGAPFVVVAASTGEPPADAVVDRVTDAFGGGGGGSPVFAQGGGLSADPDEVVAHLRGEE